MHIGAMKYQIYLQSKTSSTLPSGQENEVWSNATNPIFSAIDWVSATEKNEGSQDVAARTAKFTIYNIGTITAENTRISYNSEVFEVTTVTPIDNEMFLEIVATTKDNQNAS